MHNKPVDLVDYFQPDDWHRQIRYRNNQVFLCPSTGSIYSYDFNAHVYGIGTKQLESAGKTLMQYESGFLTGSPSGPHYKGYNTTYCDGHGKWMPGAFEPGQAILLR